MKPRLYRLLLLTTWTATLFSNQITSIVARNTSPLGQRLPPVLRPLLENDECETGRLCVGPLNDHYPIGHEPGVLFTSRFRVPPLPESYDSEKMTYYDYFNIFFRDHPKGGYFNQFVPQLMLGNVLANSTNHPDYTPIWQVLDQWHIGAQYFFALLCDPEEENIDDAIEDNSCWNAYAATGKLIAVVPGELVETTFELVEVEDVSSSYWEWHLSMGVVGDHPSRWSRVVVPTPYMGLVSNTEWHDDIYINITVGSCLENYGMAVSANYPQTWEIQMDIVTPERSRSIRGASFNSWDDWKIAGGQKCSWLPQSTIQNVQGSNWQRATWNATLLDTYTAADVA